MRFCISGKSKSLLSRGYSSRDMRTYPDCAIKPAIVPTRFLYYAVKCRAFEFKK